MQPIAPYTGPVVVTLVYLALYYAFQLRVLQVKTRLQAAYAARGEKLDRYFGQDRELLAADRVQLNTLEHMPPFLVLLWLNAVFVSAGSATLAGAVYLCARTLYPFAMGPHMGRQPRAAILLSTVPGYAALVWFIGALAYTLATT